MIIKRSESSWWNVSHYQVPVVLQLDDVFRIFYATRDKENVSRVGRVDIAPGSGDILDWSSEPSLDIGLRGRFDDSGVMPTSINVIGQHVVLYYIGWFRGHTVPFSNAIGCAVSSDFGMTFSKLYEGPIVTRSRDEPYFVGTARVYGVGLEAGFEMIYSSGVGWSQTDETVPSPLYDFKLARSIDGFAWDYPVELVVPLNNGEGGLSSPNCLTVDGFDCLIYCGRNSVNYRTGGENAYQLWFAVKVNGSYKRTPLASLIRIGKEFGNCEMQCYPWVVEHKGEYHMFYNGNGFGQTGILHHLFTAYEIRKLIKACIDG